jgi:tetratricopeptide (TPR) repeat protein
MSLLLEALKKAEKAKQEAQRRAEGQSTQAGLRLQDDSPPDNKAVTARRELPDISQPLEILRDEITPKARPLAAAPQRMAPAAVPPRPRPASPEESAAQFSDQASAKKVFEAKFREPNPRLPFHLTMGALGIAILCTVGYFWYQLRPPASLVNVSPPPAGERPMAAAAPAAAPDSAVPAVAPLIPGLPTASARPAAVARAASPEEAAPAPAPLVPAARLPASPIRSAVPSQPARFQAALQPEIQSAPRPLAQVHPKVESGYAAFLAGDMPRALADYRDALQAEPANRDALLGLAAVDVRSGRLEAAEALYLQLLRADPRDSHAQAALIALRGVRMDPLVAESRVKTLLAADPAAHVLNFTLGNQLAQQGRWAEAQQQYFKAFVAEPQNADFAYNLAVSLDHLRQAKIAIEYYQRALALAATRGASFDGAAARERIAQLGK